MRIVSPYTYPHNWLKGNFHTHTTRSDGKSSPAEVIAAYRDDNYDFLALTDHHKLSKGDEGGAGDMLLLPGQECHVPGDSKVFEYHIVGLGVKKQIPAIPDGQGIIDAIRKAGGMAFVAHPRWSWMPYEIFEGLEGYVGMEVHNGNCEVTTARGHSVDYWDKFMTERKKPLYVVGVDDMHLLSRDFGTSWTCVNAKKNARSIYDALKRGDAYASSGPRFETIYVNDESITVHTTAAKCVKFVGKYGDVRQVTEPGTLGEYVKSATYHPTGNEVYIRVEIHAHDGRIAWSNPFMIEP